MFNLKHFQVLIFKFKTFNLDNFKVFILNFKNFNLKYFKVSIFKFIFLPETFKVFKVQKI